MICEGEPFESPLHELCALVEYILALVPILEPAFLSKRLGNYS